MSLLRNVLKKNTANSDAPPVTGLSTSSKKRLLTLRSSLTDLNSDARSMKSSGGVTVHSVRSIAESITSFTSVILGGKGVPKRRRPDVSRLGVPKWYEKGPPPAPEMPGTEMLSGLANRPFVVGHAQSRTRASGEPYMSMILYNHASSTAKLPRYYDGARVTGELRIRLRKPESVASIDIWCLARCESSLAVMDGNFVQQHVNLYNRKTPSDTGPLVKDKLFVFPFQFKPLPADIRISRPDSLVVTRAPLPPSHSFHTVGGFSGEIKYFIAMNIKREGIMAMDELWDVQFQYFPIRRPILKQPSMFPFIPDREDWPYTREEIGGWTVTPFGGRGRFRNETVEIEGLLGIQAPEVYTAGQRLRYSLLLWSKSIPALGALANPTEADIDVVFMSCDMFGKDVLHPRASGARNNRYTKRLAQGRVWRTDDGPPEGDQMPVLRDGSAAKKPGNQGSTIANNSAAEKKPAVVRRSRMEEVFVASSSVDNTDDEGEEGVRPPSPDEDLGPQQQLGEDEEQSEGTVRLDGELLIPSGLVPSFRHRWIGREYVLHITFTHTDYSHISPSAVGIYAETPVWIVLGKPGQSDQGEAHDISGQESGLDYLATLPILGDAVPVTEDAVRAAISQGISTTKTRPLHADRNINLYRSNSHSDPPPSR